MEELEELRSMIDEADNELLHAFEKRMEIAEKIGELKGKNGKRVLDPAREREKLCSIYDMADDRTKPYISPLYSLLFEVSRGVQSKFAADATDEFKIAL